VALALAFRTRRYAAVCLARGQKGGGLHDRALPVIGERQPPPRAEFRDRHCEPHPEDVKLSVEDYPLAHALQGRVFGRLTVLSRAPSVTPKNAMWRCHCECGNEAIVRGQRLLAGQARSCGCGAREARDARNFRHGEAKTRLHNIWNQMRQRCRGGKKRYEPWTDVKVCAEWDSFLPFRDWALANGYADNLTIERMDPYGDYAPGNCTWIPKAEQSLNTRKNPRDWTTSR
jgi:hypothetical protein